MKKTVVLLIALLPILLTAQKEGSVTFKEVVKFTIELPEDSPISEEQFRAMMPDEQVSQKILYFDESASLFTDAPEAENPDGEHSMSSEDGQIQIKMVRASGDNKIFHDIKENKIVDQRDFLGKTFLVQDKAKAYQWKLTGESKEIAGYPCQQATATDDDRTIEVWFTSAIPISTGPDGYLNLPGFVLEVHTKAERAERWLTAQQVSFETLEKDILKAPTKGKKVTSDEYDKIVEEKTKEMAEQNGGRGVRIRIGN